MLPGKLQRVWGLQTPPRSGHQGVFRDAKRIKLIWGIKKGAKNKNPAYMTAHKEGKLDIGVIYALIREKQVSKPFRKAQTGEEEIPLTASESSW